MAWDDTRSLIIAACGTCLEPHGYKLVKSRDAFEKSSASERRGVYILLVASKHGNYKLRVWCGVRNSAIERRFSRSLNLPIPHPTSSTAPPVFPGFFGL